MGSMVYKGMHVSEVFNLRYSCLAVFTFWSCSMIRFPRGEKKNILVSLDHQVLVDIALEKLGLLWDFS